ncbi:DUF456 domain-containing protein [Desulfovibrio inopinatus]|uniref:DUF456 domain-containing protein n=1 Tax=Desulfovibrio inopinatus TaxID=102109 RepID=UPI0003F53F5C|nr:DUF456 domain-containing protein [Desulfovibrio inopinatus]
MSIFAAVLFLLVLFAVLGLHIFSLPANWIILALVGLWGWTHPALHLGTLFYVGLVGLALFGEILEFVAQYIGGKKYGGTSRGNIGSLIGALAGAILGTPFLLGIGALIGAIAGAYAGSFIFEYGHCRSAQECHRAAMGAMFGKVLGIVVKIGAGAIMFGMTARAIWPQ